MKYRISTGQDWETGEKGYYLQYSLLGLIWHNDCVAGPGGGRGPLLYSSIENVEKEINKQKNIRNFKSKIIEIFDETKRME